MLSKFALIVSSGRKSPALISSPKRSRTARAYSARFRRWNVRLPGFGLAAAALSSVASSVSTSARSVSAAGRRRAGRRHHLRAQLANHLLAGVGRLRALSDARDVEALEREIAAARAIVVAGAAIGANDGRELVARPRPVRTLRPPGSAAPASAPHERQTSAASAQTAPVAPGLDAGHCRRRRRPRRG